MSTIHPAPARRLLLTHDECEHSGDIARNHEELRDGGLRFNVVFELTAHGPEVGVSVIETSATDAQVKAAIDKSECCVRGFRPGTVQDARDWIDQEESEHRADEEEEG